MQAPARQPTFPVTLASSNFLSSRQPNSQDILAKEDIDDAVKYIKWNESSPSEKKKQKKATQKAKKLAAAGSESGGLRTVLSSASKHSVPLPQQQLTQQQQLLPTHQQQQPSQQQQFPQQQQPLGQQHPALIQSAQDNKQFRRQYQWQQTIDFWKEQANQTGKGLQNK
jgi:hypothetical protein